MTVNTQNMTALRAENDAVHVILKYARLAIKRPDTNEVIAKEKLRYDYYFVRNHGMFPDFVIIL